MRSSQVVMPVSQETGYPYNVFVPKIDNQTIIDTNIYIIPDWIFRALVRSNLNYIDIKNFNRIKDVLSTEDRAIIIACNCFISEFNKLIKKYNDNIDLSYNPGLHDFQKEEVGLSCTNYFIKDILERLSADDISNNNEYYEVLSGADNNVYVKVKKGFMNVLNIPSYRKSICSDIVKNLYKFNSIEHVSNYNVFYEYVSLV